jgi:hypothetical protein
VAADRDVGRPVETQSTAPNIEEAPLLVKLALQSAIYAGAQQPVDGLFQLANHIWKPLTGHELQAPQFFGPPPPVKPYSQQWAAELIGQGLGRTADIAAIGAGLRVTGVTGA